MTSLPLSLSQFMTIQYKFIFGGTRRSCNKSYVKSFLILRGVVWAENDRTKTIITEMNQINKSVKLPLNKLRQCHVFHCVFRLISTWRTKTRLFPQVLLLLQPCRHRSNFYLPLNQLPPRTCCRSFGSCYKT